MNLESFARRVDEGEIPNGAFLVEIQRGNLDPGEIIPAERMCVLPLWVPTLQYDNYPVWASDWVLSILAARTLCQA